MERARKHKKSGVLGLVYISVLVCTQFVHEGLDPSCSKIKFRTILVSFNDRWVYFFTISILWISLLSMPCILKVILPSSVGPNFSCPKTMGL